MSDDLQSRLAAALEGRYRLERELGAGGMATVFLAMDLKHHRRVAIKVLHAELSAMLGPERFLKEIELTASLQHPHILPLFDSGAAGGLLFYVMPFVEGETLRGRLTREKQLPVADAVQIATEVADALQYAHEKGIVHRDIKPENVLLQNGHALVADFGIALAVVQAGGTRMTQTGLSLGTPQYMSPEQAMGERDIGPRSDIYSLGAVTYEMLAGTPPFTGPTAQAIVAQVLTTDVPPLRERRRSVPEAVDAAVATALEKLPADRFSSAAAFARALIAPDPGRTTHAARGVTARRPWWRDARTWITVAALVLAAVAAWRGWRIMSNALGGPAATFTVDPGVLPQPGQPRIALSPDGALLVYAALVSDSGRVDRELFRRPLDRLDATPIAGTDSATDPFFSPDGAWIGYYTGTAIKKVPIMGGAPVTVVDSVRGTLGATWTDDHTIVFAWRGGLWDVPDAGGARRALLHDSTVRVSWPTALPGQDRYLFFACHVGNCQPVPAVLDPATRRLRTLLDDQDIVGAWFAPPHTLLLQRQSGELSAVAFDAGTLTLRGPVQRNVPSFIGTALAGAEVALSRRGTVAAIPHARDQDDELVWVDRAGNITPITHQPRRYLFPRVSPDGRKIAMEIHDQSLNGSIWVYDLASQTLTRITNVGHSTRPAWSPDSKRLAYISLRGDSSGIYVTPADRSAPERAVYVGPVNFFPLSWSPDGKWIATERAGPPSPQRPRQADLIAIPVSGGPPRVILSTPADEHQPVFSPDGKWLAYVSDESGLSEVYVTPFPGPGGRWAVTNDGGDEPVWSPKGGELFYRAPDGWLTAATLSLGAEVTVTRRQRLFSMQLSGEFVDFGESPYDVAPDGQRFVMARSTTPSSSIIVATDWTARVLGAMARRRGPRPE